MKTTRIGLAVALLVPAAGYVWAHAGPEDHSTPEASRRVSTEASKKVGESAIVLATANNLTGGLIVAERAIPDLAKEDPIPVLNPVPRFKPGEPLVLPKPSPKMEETQAVRELAATVGEATTSAAHVEKKPEADASGAYIDRTKKVVERHGKPIAPAPNELNKLREADILESMRAGLRTMNSQLNIDKAGGSYILSGQESFMGGVVGAQAPVATEVYKRVDPLPPHKP